MRPLTEEWVEKAEGDYRVALGQWESTDPVWDAICFHAEQCAEKYLKAWLVEEGVDFPKTHDLEALAELSAPSLSEIAALMDGLRFPTGSATGSATPAVFAHRTDARKCWQVSLDVPEPSPDEAGSGRLMSMRVIP